MIYFVNTLFLEKGTYTCVDKESEEYKANYEKVVELNKQEDIEKEKLQKQLEQKYPEFFEALDDEEKDEMFHLKYGYENDFTDEYSPRLEDEKELQQELFVKYGTKIEIKGDFSKYLCYFFEGPHPTYEEYYNAFVDRTWYSFSDIKGPEKTEKILVVRDERTPIMFTDLEEAKKFVERNECDWEECYYNYADIQGIEPGCCYPNPNNEKQMTHLVFSTEEGWIESKTVEFDHWFVLEIQGKKVFRIQDNDFRGYNGTVDIG